MAEIANFLNLYEALTALTLLFIQNELTKDEINILKVILVLNSGNYLKHFDIESITFTLDR